MEKDVIDIIVDDSDDILTEEIIDSSDKETTSLLADIPPLLIKLSCGAAVLIVILSLATGIFIPKSLKSIDKRLVSLRQTDKIYLEKQSEYEAAQSEEKQLKNHLDEKNAELEKLGQSQDSLDKLSEKNSELQNEKQQLQNEVNTKKNTLNSLNASLNSHTTSSITCPSGRYTVGENITEGKYIITGTGSIVVSSSNTARVNKSLKSDGESFTLNNGDIVQINGNAKLILE